MGQADLAAGGLRGVRGFEVAAGAPTWPRRVSGWLPCHACVHFPSRTKRLRCQPCSVAFSCHRSSRQRRATAPSRSFQFCPLEHQTTRHLPEQTQTIPSVHLGWGGCSFSGWGQLGHGLSLNIAIISLAGVLPLGLVGLTGCS